MFQRFARAAAKSAGIGLDQTLERPVEKWLVLTCTYRHFPSLCFRDSSLPLFETRHLDFFILPGQAGCKYISICRSLVTEGEFFCALAQDD